MNNNILINEIFTDMETGKFDKANAFTFRKFQNETFGQGSKQTGLYFGLSFTAKGLSGFKAECSKFKVRWNESDSKIENVRDEFSNNTCFNEGLA